MNLQLLKDLNNLLLMPLLYSNPDPIIRNNPYEKKDYLRIWIKTQQGEAKNDTVSLFVLILKTGSSKALLKFLIIINKIIEVQNLKTAPQRYDMELSSLPEKPLKFY